MALGTGPPRSDSDVHSAVSTNLLCSFGQITPSHPVASLCLCANRIKWSHRNTCGVKWWPETQQTSSKMVSDDRWAGYDGVSILLIFSSGGQRHCDQQRQALRWATGLPLNIQCTLSKSLTSSPLLQFLSGRSWHWELPHVKLWACGWSVVVIAMSES